MAHLTAPPSALLERASELAAFQALIEEAAAAGRGRLVVIEGPAGIGKTALLAEARRLAERSGFTVLSARAGELETGYAFGVVRQLLEPTVAAAGDRERATLLGGAARFAASVLGGASEGKRADQDSFSTLHGLYWLTANLAGRDPLLIAVDDLHWVDEPTLEWLAYLSRRLEGLPLLLVCATRSPQQAAAPSLVTELLSDSLATVIRPGPLGAESVGSLASDRLQQTPDEGFTDALVAATAGNPLYLAALLDAVATAGIEPNAGSQQELADLAPEALTRSVTLRLSRLPAEAARLVRAAAVLGDTTPLAVTAPLAGLDQMSALSAATLLIRHDLLVIADPPTFRHPVVRAAVYSEIDAAERSATHKRAAEALLAAGGPAEQAAAHLIHAVPDTDRRVVDTLRQAARSARSRGAPDAAITYLRRALAEQVDDETGAVLWELGSAEHLLGRADMVDSLARALELTHDPAQRATVKLEYCRALWLSSRADEAIEVAQQSLDNSGAVDATLREQLWAGLLGVSWGHARFSSQRDQQLSRLREDELAGGIGSERLLAFKGELEARRGVDRLGAIALAERSLASGNVVRDRDLAFYAAATALISAGEIERLGAVVDAGLTEAQQGGDLVSTCQLISLRAVVELQRGNLRAATQDIEDALELAALMDLRTDSMRHAYASLARKAWIGLELGNTKPAHDLLATFDSTRAEMNAAQLMFLFEIRGRLRLLEREPENALSDFLECGEAARSLAFANPANGAWRSQAALALLALDRRDEAFALAAEETELARRWGEPRALGVSLRALGLVEGGTSQEEHLREALATLVESPNRLEHARVLVDLGAALRRANRRSEARKHLRQALELADWCGATTLFARANDELAATGAHRRTVVLRGVDALTASERRVARMAADGASNKEVAQALFVTVKTVEMHLGHVYRKLEISSRTQLAEALDQQQTPAASPTP